MNEMTMSHTSKVHTNGADHSNDLKNVFGSNVFNDAVMRKRLPKAAYAALHKTIDEGSTLEIGTANAVASEMRKWAMERGATHYTHWFQPLTGITAEKHDSFLVPGKDGTAIIE